MMRGWLHSHKTLEILITLVALSSSQSPIEEPSAFHSFVDMLLPFHYFLVILDLTSILIPFVRLRRKISLAAAVEADQVRSRKAEQEEVEQGKAKGQQHGPGHLRQASLRSSQGEVRKQQKKNAEENLHKVVLVATEIAEITTSEGKAFCITQVDVGLDATAVREAAMKVLERKGISVMVLSTDETTNKAVVCAGVSTSQSWRCQSG